MKTGLYLGEVPIGKVVVAVAGENGIQLQEKIVTPSKGDPIEVIPDIGIDGLSKVIIEPIPDAYIDTTTDNAPYAGDMLKGTVAFANTNKIEGALEGKDILEYSADGLSFKDGNLVVSSTNAERAIVKAEADVSITVEGADLGNATAADVLNGKTFTSENGLVIEGTGPTLANLDTTSSNVLAGKKFIGSNGIEETGTMANLGNVSATLNSTTKSKTILEGYTTGGTISLGTNVVDTTISSNAAAASTMLSGKKAYANGSLITGNIATKTSSNLTTSGATVYAPAGYYASQASKSISSGTLSSPSISVSSSGVITATSGVSTSGYLSTSASKSNTKSLTTQAAKTITPSTSSQTAVASGVYTTGTITVGAIPSSYVQPSYTLAGGAYVINPGDEIFFSAKTYLTDTLSVMATAASGGGSVGIGSPVKAAGTSNNQRTFSGINYDDCVGCIIIRPSDGGSHSGYKDLQVIFINGEDYQIISYDSDTDNTAYDSGTVGTDDISVWNENGDMVVHFTSTAFRWRGSYYCYPIY